MNKETKNLGATPTKEAEQFVQCVQDQLSDGAERVAKGVSDYTDFAKDTASAFSRSAGVGSKAAEKINAELLELTNDAIREGVSFAKQASSVKNIGELLELQASYTVKTWGDTVAKAAAINDVARGAVETAIEVTSDRIFGVCRSDQGFTRLKFRRSNREKGAYAPFSFCKW